MCLLARIIVYRQVLGICRCTPQGTEFSLGDRDFLSCSNRSLLCKTHVILNCVTVSVYRLCLSRIFHACLQPTTKIRWYAIQWGNCMHNRRFLSSIGKYTSSTIGNSRERQLSLFMAGRYLGHTALLIVNVGTRWEWSTSRPGWLDPGKERRHPLSRRLGRSF
jgi:hypothetical protein